MRPGSIVEYDFRTQAKMDASRSMQDGLRVVQWNIERGYQLARIIDELSEADADVIILQELDINCERTQYVNVPEAIAKALEMQCVFVVEFEELHCASRSHENRVGQPQLGQGAFHGNAILSRKYSLQSPRAIEHSFNLRWEECGKVLKEPRKGTRPLLTCFVHDALSQNVLHLYCLHLEIFCGILGRVRQLSDAIHDAQKILEGHNERGRRQSLRFIIAGDLNTIGHSIVRLSRNICTDRMRVLSFGENEADWLQRKVLARTFEARRGIIFGLWNMCFGSSLAWRVLYGFSSDEFSRFDNSNLAFYDPFHKYHDVSLDNAKYKGFVQGKLDWTLLSNIKCTGTRMFNRNYAASDHCGLVVDCEFPPQSLPRQCYAPSARELFPTVLPYIAVRIALLYFLRFLLDAVAVLLLL